MSKEFFVVNNHGHNIGPTGGMHEREAAEKVAQHVAQRFPGRVVRVMQRVAEFKFPK